MTERTRTTGRRFQFILIKPSHYDKDGYVVQWMRSTMPSNSLAAVYSLAQDAANRGVLGPDLPIDVIAIDETNTRVKFDELIRRIQDNGGEGLVGVVGVQSNEFPRATDIARRFLGAGIQVMIGGFHVSGCLAMLPELPDDIKEARKLGRIYPRSGIANFEKQRTIDDSQSRITRSFQLSRTHTQSDLS